MGWSSQRLCKAGDATSKSKRKAINGLRLSRKNNLIQKCAAQREEELRTYKAKLVDDKLLADSQDVADRQPVFLKDKGDALYKQGNYRSSTLAAAPLLLMGGELGKPAILRRHASRPLRISGGVQVHPISFHEAYNKLLMCTGKVPFPRGPCKASPVQLSTFAADGTSKAHQVHRAPSLALFNVMDPLHLF
eukprot:82065-Pelagomonas_calceolata.AAC.5